MATTETLSIRSTPLWRLTLDVSCSPPVTASVARAIEDELRGLGLDATDQGKAFLGPEPPSAQKALFVRLFIEKVKERGRRAR